MFNKKKYSSIEIITFSGILSAIGIIVNYIEIPYPLVPWLKIDLSEIVVLIATLLNIWVAVIVSIVKGLLLLLLKPALPIGNFVLIFGSLTICISYYFLSKKFNKMTSLILMSIIFTVVMVVSNYFIITPIYSGMTFAEAVVQPNYLKGILLIYVPFNLFKIILVSIGFYFISNRLEKE
ncbi:MAG: ECF transporter S component [Mycoplasmatales bacterium]